MRRSDFTFVPADLADVNAPDRAEPGGAAVHTGHRRLVGEVLVATDGRAPADAALAVAAALARRDQAPLRAIAVLEESVSRAAVLLHAVVPNYLERWRTDRLYARVHTQALRVLGDTATAITLAFGAPGRNVAGRAAADRAALVVVGLGLRTPYARLFGDDTALDVVRAVTCPVLAVAATQPTLPKRVLVATDFTPASEAAAHAALGVIADGGIVHLCHVEADPDVFPVEAAEWRRVYERGATALLAELRAQLTAPDSVTVSTHVLAGDPASALLKFAVENGVDLVATGTRRLRPLARLAEGSVAARLLRDAPCSVLVAPATPTAARGSGA